MGMGREHLIPVLKTRSPILLKPNEAYRVILFQAQIKNKPHKKVKE